MKKAQPERGVVALRSNNNTTKGKKAPLEHNNALFFFFLAKTTHRARERCRSGSDFRPLVPQRVSFSKKRPNARVHKKSGFDCNCSKKSPRTYGLLLCRKTPVCDFSMKSLSRILFWFQYSSRKSLGEQGVSRRAAVGDSRKIDGS